MRQKRLDATVEIVDKAFWNQAARLALEPASDGSLGWYWRCGGIEFPLGPHLAQDSFCRFLLRADGYELHIAEHILALRYAGIGGVVIDSTRWPPYGLPIRFLDATVGKTADSDEQQWVTVDRTLDFIYPTKRLGRICYLQIRPATQPRLEIEIVCGYRGIGETTVNYLLPNGATFHRLASTGAPGWPPWRIHVSRFATRFCAWPYHYALTWPQEHSAKVTLRRFADHRAYDILGALALLGAETGHLFAGKVKSVCAGHKADIALVKRAASLLVPLEP